MMDADSPQFWDRMEELFEKFYESLGDNDRREVSEILDPSQGPVVEAPTAAVDSFLEWLEKDYNQP